MGAEHGENAEARPQEEVERVVAHERVHGEATAVIILHVQFGAEEVKIDPEIIFILEELESPVFSCFLESLHDPTGCDEACFYFFN